jgi:hypothetical protein
MCCGQAPEHARDGSFVPVIIAAPAAISSPIFQMSLMPGYVVSRK